MKISIFGLGYVGTVTGACLAKQGLEVIGVDNNKAKVEQVNCGKSPIFEPGLDKLLTDVVKEKKFKATCDTEYAVLNSDISLVAVGTYSSADGYPDLRAIYGVMDDIGLVIKNKNDFHSVIIRSTVPPGTTSIALNHIEKKSGKIYGKEFGGGMNPEFLREGSALFDFENPPFIVVGVEDDITARSIKSMYNFLDTSYYQTQIRLAEILKYSCNAFHALKVAFGNEIGRICSSVDIDGRELLNIFTQDRVLNISDKYLTPGVPFGGSCLPKDLRALVTFAESKGAHVPLLGSILDSNDSHFAQIIKKIENLDCSRIGILGITFKENTDDVRESPIIKLTRCLIDRDFNVSIYDDNMHKQTIIGSNKELIDRKLPEFLKIMTDTIPILFDKSELVIITNSQYLKNDDLLTLLAENKHLILDLCGKYAGLGDKSKYHGLCW